jgi:hypothetical protein
MSPAEGERMPDLEGAGEAVTGAALARAVEPDSGEPGDGHTHESNCLNCGCKLVGAYCHCCGQRGHVHRTIAAWWHDFLHSVLHLDGKFWRTLPLLAWRPGELTRRYAHGERASFISPLALFLFTVFLMFAVFSVLGGTMEVDSGAIQQGLQEQNRSQETAIADPRKERSAAARQDGDTTLNESRLAEMREEQTQPQGVATGTPAFTAIGVETGWAPLDRAIGKANRNPSLLIYKMQANAYKFSWALIPISVPFVWILFLHRQRYRRAFTSYDHLVFVTYSIAFMSLLLILLTLIRSAGVGNGLLLLAFMMIPPLHIYRQLRGTYLLSRFSAAWRTFALVIFAFVALSLFTVLLLLLGLVG